MAQFASGTFTGATGTELSAHDANWVNRLRAGGENCVLTNANRVRGPANNNEYYHNGTPASADYTVEADFYVASALANVSASVFGRASTTYTSGYFATLYVGSGLRLYKQVGGAFSLITTYAFTLVAGTTYHVKLEMIGTAIKVYLDDVQRISVTDSAVSAVGKSGIRLAVGGTASSDTTHLHIDNFSADDIGGSTPLVGTGLSEDTELGTGAVTATIVTLVGAGLAQDTELGTGAVTVIGILIGVGLDQDTELGTGAVTVLGVLTGVGLAQDTELGTGSVTVIGAGLLVGDSILDVGTSGTGALTISHLLIGTGLDQDTELGVAAIIPATALTPQQSAWLQGIALLHGLVPASPLIVSPTARNAGAVTQTVATVGGTVTVTTTGAPGGAPGTSALSTLETQWLENLARLYGLIDPIAVTATTRGDGTLSQTISEVSGTTTVTKT